MLKKKLHRGESENDIMNESEEPSWIKKKTLYHTHKIGKYARH